jgi:hypothetical protein
LVPTDGYISGSSTRADRYCGFALGLFAAAVGVYD